MEWSRFPKINHKFKLFKELRQIVNQENYDRGLWNLTDLVLDEDPRKFAIYEILQGTNHDKTFRPDMAPLISFRLQVLTRQACCENKHGDRMWSNEEAREIQGEESDLLPNYDELPHKGDIVEWKGHARSYDPETEKPVDSKILKRWAAQNKRPNDYHRFEVDGDGCITVRYPQVLEMLSRKGVKSSKPRFRKVHRRDRKDQKRRRLTNWWFKEVPAKFKKPRKAIEKPLVAPEE